MADENKIYEKNILTIHNGIKKRNITPGDDLASYGDIVKSYAYAVLNGVTDPPDDVLKALIMICLDQYTYADNVLISDREYDMLHKKLMSRGFEQVIYPDVLVTTWPRVQHDIPALVGSIAKVYDTDELYEFIKDTQNEYNYEIPWVISPKYDGISAVIMFESGVVIRGMTRGTREKGQDITPVIDRIENINALALTYPDGYLKVELCVPTENFGELEKAGYANRRSATSAIVNSPKNIELAKYIKAVPLLHYNNGEVTYAPYMSKKVYGNPDEIINDMEFMLHRTKNPDFPYRVDGVVAYPATEDIGEDAMAKSIAYKINTSEARTRAVAARMSVGRSGAATPMLIVEPCDVNETVVRNVSLGSIALFQKYCIYEGEEVIIYSAGDVIPQFKFPPIRNIPKGAKPLMLNMLCPYCGSIIKNNRCHNNRCPRIVTGRISAFVAATGVAKNIADKTIEDLYNARLISLIPDIFKLIPDDIANVPGYTMVSATKIVNEIKKISETPMYASVFFGSIGIPGVSKKTARTILQSFDLDEVLYMAADDSDSLGSTLMLINGVGDVKAMSIANYIRDNYSEIQELREYLNIVPDISYLGNVVFTGFRDKEWEDKFEAEGFQVSDRVTSQTVCCIYANENTAKVKMSRAKNIICYPVTDIAQALESAKERVKVV